MNQFIDQVKSILNPGYYFLRFILRETICLVALGMLLIPIFGIGQNYRSIADEEELYEACLTAPNRSKQAQCYKAYIDKFPKGKYFPKAQSRFNLLANEYRNFLCNKALRENTITALQEFYNNYPDDPGGCSREVIERLNKYETDLWNTAVTDPYNLEAYQTYLKYFDDGRYAKQAQKRADLIQEPPSDAEFWQEIVVGGGGLNSLRDYLHFHPNGRYQETASEQLEDIDRAMANRAQKENTIDAYQTYLDNFEDSDGSFVEEAKSRIASLEENGALVVVPETIDGKAWLNTSKVSVRQLTEFKEKYPESPYVTDANERLETIEDREWLKAQRTNTQGAFEQYLIIFPEGKYVEEANEFISQLRPSEEDILWKDIFGNGNLASYEKYLSNYPEGKYSDLARDSVRRLSPIDQTIRPEGTKFVIEFNNALNPKLKAPLPQLDSIVLDDSELEENNRLTAFLVQEGKYTFSIVDEWGKETKVDLENILQAVMIDTLDTLIFAVTGGKNPYNVFFEDTSTFSPVTFKVPANDTLKLERSEQLADLDGVFYVLVKDARVTQVVELGILQFNRSASIDFLRIGLLVLLLFVGIVIWYYFNQRINKSKSLLDEIDSEENY